MEFPNIFLPINSQKVIKMHDQININFFGVFNTRQSNVDFSNAFFVDYQDYLYQIYPDYNYPIDMVKLLKDYAAAYCNMPI